MLAAVQLSSEEIQSIKLNYQKDGWTRCLGVDLNFHWVHQEATVDDKDGKASVAAAMVAGPGMAGSDENERTAFVRKLEQLPAKASVRFGRRGFLRSFCARQGKKCSLSWFPVCPVWDVIDKA